MKHHSSSHQSRRAALQKLSLGLGALAIGAPSAEAWAGIPLVEQNRKLGVALVGLGN